MSTSLTYILYLITIMYTDVHEFFFLELCQNFFYTSNLKCLQIFVSMVILYLDVQQNLHVSQHAVVCQSVELTVAKCQKCPMSKMSVLIAKGFSQ